MNRKSRLMREINLFKDWCHMINSELLASLILHFWKCKRLHGGQEIHSNTFIIAREFDSVNVIWRNDFNDTLVDQLFRGSRNTSGDYSRAVCSVWGPLAEPKWVPLVSQSNICMMVTELDRSTLIHNRPALMKTAICTIYWLCVKMSKALERSS